jgi:nicotinamide-nucleotide amidase
MPSPPTVELFSQGEEVVRGQIADTNAAWLSERLSEMGLDVTRHTAVGDRLDALVGVLCEISGRADCCICTGGLGPTQDDLTAEAAARAFNLKLLLDATALADIERQFARLGQRMPGVNRKQALLPAGACRLDNRWGTAPGFALDAGRCWFVFLPGVPHEMKSMFDVCVRPLLERRFELCPGRLITLRAIGIGESAIQEKLDAVRLPGQVTLSFRAAMPENHVKLMFPPDFDAFELEKVVAGVKAAIGDAVFSVDGLAGPGGDLAAVIARLLIGRQETLAAGETVSGGRLASLCASQPWFLEGCVLPDPVRFAARFGIALPQAAAGRALCEAARSIAEQLREKTGATFGLAQLPCIEAVRQRETSGTVQLCNALATPAGAHVQMRRVGGSVERKQIMAATASLDLLRRHLQGCLSPTPPDTAKIPDPSAGGT